jgi:hypothetical protein
MDLKSYYQKIRETHSKIGQPFPIVVSHETQDGGKPGVMTEVPCAVAAKMVVEGTARLATPKEEEAFRTARSEAKREADAAAEAAKVQMTLVPAAVWNQTQRRTGGGRDQA